MEPTFSSLNIQNADTSLNPASLSDSFIALQSRLEDCRVINEAGGRFIPNGELEQVLTDDAVRTIVRLLVFRGELTVNVEDYTLMLCKQKSLFRKILALLLLIDMPEAITAFVDRGIDDLDLPMPDPRQVLANRPSCKSEEAVSTNKWKSLANSELSRSCLRKIYETQWCLLAPSFSRQDGINHYKFTGNHILPFLPISFLSPSNSQVFSPLDEIVRRGSFSQVRRVKIHPMHHDFKEYGVSNETQQFAVKRLLAHDYEDFVQELEIFKRYWRSNIRIVPLLATFEVIGTIPDDNMNAYCLIFPWATGDLRLFWETNEQLVQDHRIIPWILRECYEITRTLSYIHGDLVAQMAPEDSFGRHGDIKPSNILWYPNSSEIDSGDFGKLVLSDFGLADFHSASSRTNSSSSSLPRSMTYRAPEFDTTKVVSRGIDIWALGCTFLEFITWFLKGNKAVRDDFRESRSEFDTYGIYADIFFRVQQHENYDDVLLKPQVVDWIACLCNDGSCSTYLRDFLDIVRYDMLVVDRSKRGTAGTITQRLETLYLRCVGDNDPKSNTSEVQRSQKDEVGTVRGGRVVLSLRKIFRRHQDRLGR